MEMQFRTLSYTQGQKPQPCSLSSASALHTPLPPDDASLATGHVRLRSWASTSTLPCFYYLRKRDAHRCFKSLLPLASYGIFHCPCFCSSLFSSFFLKNFSKEEPPFTGFPFSHPTQPSTHSNLTLTHDFLFQSPFLWIPERLWWIAVYFLEICFSDMFDFAKIVLDIKLLVWPWHFSQCLLHLALVRTLR